MRALLLAPDSPRFLVSAHRGDFFWSLLAEGRDTIRSFERARQSGADLVEADVSLTESGEPVVSHTDPGKEDDLTLERALAWADDRIVLVLDLKTDHLAPVIAEVRRAGAAGRVVFYANRPDEVDGVRAAGRDLFLMVRAHSPEDMERWIAGRDPRVILIHADLGWLDAGTLEKAHAAGLRVFVNSYTEVWHQEVFGAGSSVARVFVRGIDVAQTNTPASAARARDSRR